MFCFQILVLALCIPSGRLEPALQANADKLWPFTTNLGRVAACVGHPLSSGCLIVLRFPFEGPLCPTPFSGVGTRGSRRAPPPTPPILTGSELLKTIHQLMTRSGVPDRIKGCRALTFIRGVYPRTGDSVANPKEKRKEDEIENPSHGSPVPTLLLPLLSQWNKCLS